MLSSSTVYVNKRLAIINETVRGGMKEGGVSPIIDVGSGLGPQRTDSEMFLHRNSDLDRLRGVLKECWK